VLGEESALHQYKANQLVNLNFRSYFEGKVISFLGTPQERPVIYMKPNFVAPQGYVLWLAGLSRKVSVITKAEYLTQTRPTTVKNYTADLPLLEKGKYHLFAKYDFQIPEGGDPTVLHLKVDIPADKYLLRYMRVRLVDKGDTSKRYATQTEGQRVLNSLRLENLTLPSNGGKGYSLLIEGVPPYNTAPEGNQLQVEVISNRPEFALEEV
jgi:hypothetical protein